MSSSSRTVAWIAFGLVSIASAQARNRPLAIVAPVCYAGDNFSVLTSTSATLDGTRSKAANGGSIAYRWSQGSGPNVATLVGANSPRPTASNLIAGTYRFLLDCASAKGGVSRDYVDVKVVGGFAPTPALPSPAPAPVPSASPSPVSLEDATGYGTLIYSTDFNTSADIMNTHAQLGQGSISAQYSRSGGASFRAYVPVGAQPISSGWRSEVQFDEGGAKAGGQTPDEGVYDYWGMIESCPDVGALMGQWHGNADNTSGQLSLWIDDCRFMVMRSVQAGVNMYQSGPLMTIEKLHWYHFRWEIKFTTASDGYVRLYIDDKLYYSATGKTADGTGQFFKLGFNLFPSAPRLSPAIGYFDDLRIYEK